jgi:hypothetical protein
MYLNPRHFVFGGEVANCSQHSLVRKELQLPGIDKKFSVPGSQLERELVA